MEFSLKNDLFADYFYKSKDEYLKNQRKNSDFKRIYSIFIFQINPTNNE